MEAADKPLGHVTHLCICCCSASSLESIDTFWLQLMACGEAVGESASEGWSGGKGFWEKSISCVPCPSSPGSRDTG